MSLTDTPNANRLHIALFGRRNSGKSSLINALTGQDTALVSDTPGTTTDPVAKAMEIHGIGPCLFIDTPGFDDEGELGRMRIERTWKAVEKTDRDSDDSADKQNRYTERFTGVGYQSQRKFRRYSCPNQCKRENRDRTDPPDYTGKTPSGFRPAKYHRNVSRRE